MSLPSILIDIARNPWLSVGATVVLGATVAKVSNNDRAHAYYASLSKPPGNPPTWALGPIWGTLYATYLNIGMIYLNSKKGKTA
ncbi:hypothetical protein CcaverHIS002_0202070 [Cutaneotrichosporon cavernicola]|nr:hypothetical protein CcaverHIS002_0202070 [Cutaneotrichosporon cavernicola]